MKKTLATLIKLQKTLVDEQRQHLAKLQEILDAIVAKIAELEIEKAREQLAAENNPEACSTYGAYAQRAARTGHKLEESRQIAAHAVDAAHARLAELFEEQKRYEIAEAQRLAEEIKEEQRRERITLDEVGSVTYERRKHTKNEGRDI